MESEELSRILTEIAGTRNEIALLSDQLESIISSGNSDTRNLITEIMALSKSSKQKEVVQELCSILGEFPHDVQYLEEGIIRRTDTYNMLGAKIPRKAADHHDGPFAK